MIDPWNITNYSRTTQELEEFLIFCRIVAGKNASFAAAKTAVFLDNTLPGKFGGIGPSPFEMIAHTDDDALMEAMVEAKIGNYTVNFDFMREVQRLDSAQLRNNSPYFFETIPGIGPKTSRFFIVHSRPDARVAVLDRHILRWLHKEEGVTGMNTYNWSTPQNPHVYKKIEDAFLEKADAMGFTPAELDTFVWKSAALADWR